MFQPSHHTAHLLRDAVRAELSGALDAEQLELHYQPIVDVPTEQIVGFEALSGGGTPSGAWCPRWSSSPWPRRPG